MNTAVLLTCLQCLAISADMLQVARRNLGNVVELRHQPYNQPLKPERPFDLILFSYSLTMMNPGWEQAIEYAYNDLGANGRMAVVDFHQSKRPFFTKWMGLNHVRMQGHLLPALKTHFHTQLEEIHSAYAGLWSYLLFVGQKTPQPLNEL